MAPIYCSYSLNMMYRVTKRGSRDMEILISHVTASEFEIANTLGSLRRFPHLLQMGSLRVLAETSPVRLLHGSPKPY